VPRAEYIWLDGAEMKIHYNPKLKKLARELRKNSTLAEVLLWQRLRNKQFHSLDFHRQKPIDEYIVDFFCPKLKLIVEIDGDSHDFKQSEDAKRQARLEDFGLTVIRFLDSEVKTNLDGILRDLENKFNLSCTVCR
jgi:very-short-patch-repair endonuclease